MLLHMLPNLASCQYAQWLEQHIARLAWLLKEYTLDVTKSRLTLVHLSKWLQASFLGRKSSNPVSLLSKSSSQLGNNRSFVFGCENSNSGQVNAEELPEVITCFQCNPFADIVSGRGEVFTLCVCVCACFSLSLFVGLSAN
jgi:hypothetical protein